ncbi:MAG: polyhydroxyalkanoate synthesis regulator DNA-binding domain-containing protein [Myxococcota bacterium]
MSNSPVIIKKYGNRRLYDTDRSRYITLDELAAKIRQGVDVRVVDAKSGDDLTQATLTQIVIEGRGVAHMFPVPLLNQFIRMGDDALAEFFTRYVSAALDIYMQARRGANAISAFNPFAALPFAAGDAMARMWTSPFGTSPAAQNPGPLRPPAAAGTEGSAPPPGGDPESSAAVTDGLPGLGPSPGGGQPAPPQRNEVADLRRELEELKRVVRGAAEATGQTKKRASQDRTDPSEKPTKTKKRRAARKRSKD